MNATCESFVLSTPSNLNLNLNLEENPENPENLEDPEEDQEVS